MANVLDTLIYGYRLLRSGGVDLPARGSLNFVSGFVVADNPLTGATDVANIGGVASDLAITGQAAGDLLYFTGTAWVRRAIGATGNALKVVGGVPTWGALPIIGDVTGDSSASVVGNITLAGAARGDVYYRDAAALARLPAGTLGRFLKTLGPGADPAWSDVDKLVSAGEITITSVGNVSWNSIVDTTPIDTTSAPATIFTIATLTIPVSSARAYAARIQVRDTSGVGYYYGELRDSYMRAAGAPAREGSAPTIIGEIKTGTLAACTFAFSVVGNDVLLRVTTGIAASRISATCEALK